MRVIKIEETLKTPEINLDKANGVFEIYGKSFPEDAKDFFDPIIEWFREYITQPNQVTQVKFKLDYFNTTSYKKIMDILHTLQELKMQGNDVSVLWYYRDGDDDMHDTGETFSKIVDVPFKFASF